MSRGVLRNPSLKGTIYVFELKEDKGAISRGIILKARQGRHVSVARL